ncbi:hypothetical protein DPMN_032580 [Dreissena polymorpha]|uniref:Uncharacterized protein n=2 Tax=Dreissena polymorpha TaxID=45954 RepID=A0A9D4RKD9_DREPO|nr:hypothetical protein DPMN_032580 [Dreissena polymorpha]
MARHAWCVLLLIGFQQAYALECYECRNVTDANTCNRTITCPANESCFMGASTLVSSERMYTLSCKDNSQCHAHSVSGPLIGRSVHSSYTKRDATCNECCSSKLCNKALCNHPRPTACVDDPSVDCAKMDSIFNVCADIHKAKLVCPRFCNLCNVVDGNWNWWSSWSGCDVTCGNGTQTRNRHCDDPVPQNGGLECVGNDTDRHTCNLVPCPIHGGWNQWSPWGSCSLTCDVGMQRRDRSCDNPYPSLGGDHCFGSSRDDKICYGPGCVDGNWSLWQPWTPCTATCDVGRRSKRRLCNNPFPSLMGHYCDGPNEETDTCYNIPCADGGWSLWQNWSTCTATCGGGLRTRERMCNNPVPSLLGRYCDGSSQMIDLCNKAPCTGSDIQFVVGQLAKANCYEKREGLWMC